MAKSSINSNHWIYESNWYLLRKSCHLLGYTLKWFSALLKQVWSLGFLCSTLRCLRSFFFSVWFFKQKFNPLPDLLNTGFTIFETGLFYGCKHLEAQIRRFLISIKKMAMFTYNREACHTDAWKHFKYWLSFSNVH